MCLFDDAKRIPHSCCPQTPLRGLFHDWAVLVFRGAVFSLLSLAVQGLSAASYTYTQVSRWQEEDRTTSGGLTTYPQEFYPSKGYDVRPHSRLWSMFPGSVVSGNAKATSDNMWVSLMESAHLIGNATTRTRARDFMEDWDYNFVDPAVSASNYWSDFYVDYTSASISRSGYPLTLTGGPHAGESILGNNDLLAMGDDNTLWLDGDGSLSIYNYPGGSLQSNPTVTSFPSGPAGWNGAAFSSKVSSLIGYEEGQLYFLEGSSTVHVFNASTLAFVRTDQFKFDGDLAGRTLADVIDGSVSGFTYLGWDLGPVIAGVTAYNGTGPHHLEVTTSAASTVTCLPTTFTIKACANAACSSVYTGGVSGALSISAGGATVVYPSGSSFSIASGASQTTVTAQVTTVPAGGNVTVGLSGLSRTPSGSPTVYCGMGTAATSGGTCNYGITSSALLFSSIANHVAESVQSATLTAVRASDNSAVCTPAFANVTKAVTFTCGYSNPTTGTLPVRIAGTALNASASTAQGCDATGKAINLSFNASGTASFNVQYADVGQVSLTAAYTSSSGSDAGLSMSGSASMKTAPASFVFSNITAAPIRAGSSFSATVTATNQSGSPTPNFGQETPTQAPTLSFAKATPSGSGASSGAFSGSLGTFSSGAATATNLAWTEVGTGDLQAQLSNYLSTGLSVSGSTGSAGAVGRFIPHHFNVAAMPACGVFSYSGQPFVTTITAVNADGSTTVNYNGTATTSPQYANPVSLTAVSGGTATLSPSSMDAALFSAGVASSSSSSLTFASKLTSPLATLIRATESAGGDGVTSNGHTEPTLLFRSGRLKVSNVFGSEKAPLSVPVQVQFWSGKAWVLSSDDSCTTSIPAASVVRAAYMDHKGAAVSGWSVTSSAASISGGYGALQLSAPAPTATGSVDLAINLGSTAADQSCLDVHPVSTGAGKPWLRSRNGSSASCTHLWHRDPSWRATFGVYAPETGKLIHIKPVF